MNQMVTIGGESLTIKEYKGQRVVTFDDIDTVHSRPKGTSRRNFGYNKKHFVEGTDYFKLRLNESRTVGIESNNGGTVLTESGYLMLVKSLTDDKAWEVQRFAVRVRMAAPFLYIFLRRGLTFARTYIII